MKKKERNKAGGDMVYGIDREEMCRKIDEKQGTYNSILINLNGYIVKSEHEMRL